MKIEEGTLTEVERLTPSQPTSRLKSKLKSLDSVGVAPEGVLTTIVGPKGGGKSALVKTIIAEACACHTKTLVILSEESVLNYKRSICDGFEKSVSKPVADLYLKNVFYTSMLNWTKENKNLKSLLSFIENQIHENNFEFIMLDNFTTSFLGGAHVEKQGEAIEAIRDLVSYYEISLILVFHTVKGTNIYHKLVDGEDVRGNATSTNTAGYNYIITTFFRCTPPRSFLHIDKARYHPESNKTYWEMRYDKDCGLFVQDRKSSAQEMEALMSRIRKESSGTQIIGGF